VGNYSGASEDWESGSRVVPRCCCIHRFVFQAGLIFRLAKSLRSPTMEQNNFAAWQVPQRKTQPPTPLLKKLQKPVPPPQKPRLLEETNEKKIAFPVDSIRVIILVTYLIRCLLVAY
jgi:hypothetical protein